MVMQTAGQVTEWLSANPTQESSLQGDLKANKKAPKRLDVSKLNQDSIRRHLQPS